MKIYTRVPSNKGFTIFEVLVVITIAFLLMGIVMYSISSARQQSRDGKRISDINLIRLALEQYYDACGTYPYTLAAGVNSGCATPTTFGSFMSQIPTDPNGSAYYYYAAGTASDCYNYHIGATLENSNHPELDNDADVTSQGSIAPGTKCTWGGTGSDWATGAGNVYDFIPGR